MKKLLYILIILIQIKSASIAGQGYGSNEKESLKDALSDLSNRISVNVKSNIQKITNLTDKKYKKNISSLVSLSSSLPIKGADYKIINSPTLTKTIATISSENSLRIYVKELKRLHKNISYNEMALAKIKNTDIKYETLNQILSDMKSFEKHKIVAVLLGATNLPLLNISQSKIKLKIHKIETKVSSLKVASKIISKGIKQSDIYVSALRLNGSSQITQFARVFKKILSKDLKTVSKPIDAKYFLRGDYEVLKNYIFISFSLSDNYNKTIKNINITLSPKAYKNFQYKTFIKSFDESMNSSFIKSGKLFTQIGFKGFNRVDGIDFKKGDTVDIVAKSNKSICYFLMGHTLKKKEKFSYLLPIGSDNSPFINYITGDDVNKNIIIASEVPISEPFGSESLHIFSASIDKKGKCFLKVPKCEDNEDGLCVINGKPNKVIGDTRALNISKKRFKIEKSENSISWTSFKE